MEAALTELPAARCEPDPRSVFTPIDVDKMEFLLRSLDLYDKWEHVVVGLRVGFDVGIKSPPAHTILF